MKRLIKKSSETGKVLSYNIENNIPVFQVELNEKDDRLGGDKMLAHNLVVKYILSNYQNDSALKKALDIQIKEQSNEINDFANLHDYDPTKFETVIKRLIDFKMNITIKEKV